MKYCSKCGNELPDEAAVCPRCGHPAEGGRPSGSRPAKSGPDATIRSASTLNCIAFLLNIVILVFLATQFSAIWDEVLPEAPAADYHVSVDAFTGTVTDVEDAAQAWEEETAAVQGRQRTVLFAGVIWGVLAVLTFLLGMRLKKAIRTPSGRKLAYLYIVLAILTPTIPLLMADMLLALLMCGIGLVLFIPAILQTLAGIKFIQCGPSHA